MRTLTLIAALMLVGTAAAEFKCAKIIKGENGGIGQYIKTVDNVADVDACAKQCAETKDCTTYKFCSASTYSCGEQYTRGQRDLALGECRLAKGPFQQAEHRDTYGSITIGTDCTGATPDATPAPAKPEDHRFDFEKFTTGKRGNIKGESLKTLSGVSWGACATACLETPGYNALNMCAPLKITTTECAGGLKKEQCDLKKLTGPVEYWPDYMNTEEGDGYASGYLKTYTATPQPR